MYLLARKGILPLGASLLLSVAAYADQPAVTHTTLIPEPVIVSPTGKIATVYESWDEVAVKNFYSSKDKVTFKLDSPRQYQTIKFEMSKPVRLVSAQVYGQNNQRMALAYQSPVPVTVSKEKGIPTSFGPITKVTVTYKNPDNNQGVMSLLGYKDSEGKK